MKMLLRIITLLKKTSFKINTTERFEKDTLSPVPVRAFIPSSREDKGYIHREGWSQRNETNASESQGKSMVQVPGMIY